MAKTIMLSLVEANALLVHRMCELVPGMGWVYDGRPLLQFILHDIFNGSPTFQQVSATDILEHDGLTLEQGQSLYHEISNTVIDIVSGYMPHLTDTNHGYSYKVRDNFDLEITIPDYSLVEPNDPVHNYELDVRAEIREAIDNGGYVSEALRRFAGC